MKKLRDFFAERVRSSLGAREMSYLREKEKDRERERER